MALVVCPLCHARITVKEELLGRKAKCPKCANLIELTAGEPSPAAIAPAALKPAASRPAAPKSVAAKPSPVKPKGPSGPPPLPPPEATDFAAIQAEAPSSKKRSQPVEEVEEVEEVDELDEVGDRPSRRRRRDDDDDERDDDRDDSRRKRRGGTSGGFRWQSPRSGLQIVFYAVIATLVCLVLMQIVGMVAQFAFGNVVARGRIGPAQMEQAGTMVRVLGAISIILMVGLFIALVTYIVGHAMCCFTPADTARQRARISMYILIAAFAISIIGACLLPLIAGSMAFDMAAQAQRNPRDPMAAANAAAGTGMMLSILVYFGVVVIGALSIAWHVFWMLFHASLAEFFRDDRLKSECILFMIVSITGPVVMTGLQFAVVWLVGLNNALLIVITVFRVLWFIATIGLIVWYLLINRKVVRLIDRR